MLHAISKVALALLAFTLIMAMPVPAGHAAPMPASMLAIQASPDFTISVTPILAVRKRGTGEPYDITVTALNGFDGVINFTVTGLFPGSRIPIPPAPVVGSGESSFDILTEHPPHTPIGIFTLTITGTSGGISHSQDVTLQMR